MTNKYINTCEESATENQKECSQTDSLLTCFPKFGITALQCHIYYISQQYSSSDRKKNLIYGAKEILQDGEGRIISFMGMREFFSKIFCARYAPFAPPEMPSSLLPHWARCLETLASMAASVGPRILHPLPPAFCPHPSNRTRSPLLPVLSGFLKRLEPLASSVQG